MRLNIPDFSLVLLMGASGAGKSSFAARHFLPSEVISSDRCRGLVADDEGDQAASGDAFDVLYFIAAKRLARRRLTVLDATHLRPEDRREAVALARRYHALPVVIAFDLPAALCIERNRARADRHFGDQVVHGHVRMLRRSLRGLEREGFRKVHLLSSEEEVAAAQLVREPLYNDRRGECGPFDIIGDVHGCYDELTTLLDRLGYAPHEEAGRAVWSHPQGRRAIFLGDLIDRGPRIPEVLRLVMEMVAAGHALCVPGNHEIKLLRKLSGKAIKPSRGLAATLEQFEALPEAERAPFINEVRRFIDRLVSHYWLDGGRLVVAHAGLKEEMQGRGSGAVREFCLYGETTGEIDEYGLPVRCNWAADYRGEAAVIYGHTPVPRAEWLNRTLCIDTGCVFGGSLTALRWPEQEMVSVPAARVYVEPARPLFPPQEQRPAQHVADTLLDLDEVSGKRTVATRYQPHITLRAEQTAAALETMSRFCVDPRWLIYLPPTMSPAETSRREGVLEHPEEAFGFYRRAGVARVVMEEKHMGSRAVVVLCRNAKSARARFGVEGDGRGVIYTRTGRAFFNTAPLRDALLDRLGLALDRSGFWERFDTDWLCLDAELMPWSLKAGSLIREQYAPVGLAAGVGLDQALELLHAAAARGADATALIERFTQRRAAAAGFDAAWRRYLWEVESVDDLKLAPFHLLATEGAVHVDKPHRWHMETLAELCAADPGVLHATAWREIDLADEAQLQAACDWWQALTEAGGEGAVVKPADFITRGEKGLLQPAVKVRGREYLRIIYGPEYTLPEQLARLRERGLGVKRGLAIKEFSLGMEALHRFVEREPLRRVHECVFGVLALESEAVDPRL